MSFSVQYWYCHQQQHRDTMHVIRSRWGDAVRGPHHALCTAPAPHLHSSTRPKLNDIDFL